MRASNQMLAQLLTSLDEDGFLIYNQTPHSAPCAVASQSSLTRCLLNPETLAPFCRELAETIAQNILVSCARQDSVYFEISLRESLQSIDLISKKANLESALALAALVHISMGSTEEIAYAFESVAIGAGTDHYRMATPNEMPSDEIVMKARNLLSSKPLIDSLFSGIEGLNVAEIEKISIEFVSMPNRKIRGWFAPSRVVVNVYALKNQTWHLRHYIPFTLLVGHLMERIMSETLYVCTENNDDSVSGVHSDEGLGFELRAIGEKFDFPSDAVLETSVKELINAIDQGIQAGIIPALDQRQIKRFTSLKRRYKADTAVEYEPGPYWCDFE